MAGTPAGWQSTVAWTIFVVWAGCYGWSFLGAFWLIEPSGQGWDRGLNRLTAFFGWQIAAGMLSVPLVFLARAFPTRRPVRWLMRVPFLLGFGLVLLVVGIIAAANLGLFPGSARPDPPTTPRVPTAPAMQLAPKDG